MNASHGGSRYQGPHAHDRYMLLLPGRESSSRVLAALPHNQLIMDEDDAAPTSQAILDVVSSVRSAGPLVR